MRHRTGIYFMLAILVASCSPVDHLQDDEIRESSVVTTKDLNLEPFGLDGFELVDVLGGPTIPHYPADVVLTQSGGLLVADPGTASVVALTAEGSLDSDWGDEGRFTDVELPHRVGLDFDGNLIVLDRATGDILKLDPDGREIGQANVRDVDQSSSSDSVWPANIAIDGRGHVFVSLSGSESRVLEYDDTLELVKELNMGPLIGREAALAIAEDGSLVVANIQSITVIDPKSARVLESLTWDASAGEIMALEQDPQGYLVALTQASGLNSSERAIVRIDIDGEVTEQWFVGAPIPLGSTELILVRPGLGVDRSGVVYLPFPADHEIKVFGLTGSPPRSITGEQTGRFGQLDRIGVDREGYLYAMDPALGRVLMYSPDGNLDHAIEYERMTKPRTAFTGSEFNLSDVAVADNGTLYLAEVIQGSGSDWWRLIAFSVEGEMIAVAGGQEDDWRTRLDLKTPLHIEIGPTGEILATDHGAIVVVDLDGNRTESRYLAKDVIAVDISRQDEKIWSLELRKRKTSDGSAAFVQILQEYSPDGSPTAEGTVLLDMGSDEAKLLTEFAIADDSAVYAILFQLDHDATATWDVVRIVGNSIESLGEVPNPVTQPSVAFDPVHGRLYVTHPSAKNILVFERH